MSLLFPFESTTLSVFHSNPSHDSGNRASPPEAPPFTVRCLDLYLCLDAWHALQQAVQPFCPVSFTMETEAASSQANLLPN